MGERQSERARERGREREEGRERERERERENERERKKRGEEGDNPRTCARKSHLHQRSFDFGNSSVQNNK